MRTDIHIYLRGWFLGDEEDRVSCRRIDGLSGSLLQTGHVGVTLNVVHGTRETLLR